MNGEQLDRAIHRRLELAERRSGAEKEQARAQGVLADFDRALVRRFHRAENMHARGDLNQARGAIRESVAELAEIEKRVPGIAGQGPDRLRERPSLERERHGIRQGLDRDLSARASGIASARPM